MKRFGGKWLTLACLGMLSSFLSLLFVASVGGRSDGREIPFPAGVLANPGCFVSGCHMTTGGTLNQVGSVSFNNVPTSFFPRGNLRAGNHDGRRIDLRVPGGCCFLR